MSRREKNTKQEELLSQNKIIIFSKETVIIGELQSQIVCGLSERTHILEQLQMHFGALVRQAKLNSIEFIQSYLTNPTYIEIYL